MKIWFRDPADAETASEVVDIGLYVPAGAPAVAGALVCVTPTFTGADAKADVTAWLVPAGLSGDLDLLGKVRATGRPVMVALNGIGPQAYRAIAAADGGHGFVNLFDARDQDAISYLEQLAWLAGQTNSFAVMARGSDKLVQAAAMGAAHLIVPEPGAVDRAAIERVAAARDGGPRPTSAAEVDHLIGTEASLTVTSALKAGAVIGADDLVSAITRERGLAPNLRARIVGRVLRYDIAPGEPLNFGHLKPGERS